MSIRIFLLPRGRRFFIFKQLLQPAGFNKKMITIDEKQGPVFWAEKSGVKKILQIEPVIHFENHSPVFIFK
jgi:hypothetical protein